MATQLNNVYLRSGGKLSLALGTDPTRVYGSIEADVVTIAAGVVVQLDGSFGRGNDIIRFTGNAASYSIVRVNASTVRITDALGTSVTIPVGSAGTAIEFADATRTLSGSSSGILLGNQTVTATATTLTAGTAVEGFILTSSQPTVTEGDNGTKTLTYLLTLNKAPTSEVSINYQTTDAGTAAAGDDFQVVAGLVTFAPGQTAATVSVTVYSDTVVEADETVVLRLSGSKLVAAVDAVGTIRNDDNAAVDPTSFTVTAGDIATANATNVPVTLNIGETGNKTVTIQSDGASANQGIIINGNASASVTSGAAGDRITLSGNGNYNVSTGGGNDNVSVFGSGTNTINVGTGNDTVSGGTGDDTIVFGPGALGVGDVVNAGAGNDTVRVSGSGNVIGLDANNDGDFADAGEFAGANLIGVENIIFDGTVVTVPASVLQFLIENGLRTITASPLTSEFIITGFATGQVLDLTGLTFNGGFESITTNGAGAHSLILNTTQSNQIEQIATTNGTLTQQVIVTGPQTVAQAQALIASGETAKFTLVDTAANLALAPKAVFAKAVSVEASTDATAAQAVQIANVIASLAQTNTSLYTGSAFEVAAIKVNVTDTASMLANNASGLAIADKVTATTAATVAEANAIWGANTSGTLFTASYAVVDSATALASRFVPLTTGNNSSIVTTTSTAGFVIGQVVIGAGIPPGATITAINNNGTEFTISATVQVGAAITGQIDGPVEPANVAALNNASSVSFTATATPSIAQVVGLNTALAGAAGGLTKVSPGYKLNDTLANLTAQGNAAIVSAAGDVNVVTVPGNNTLAAIGVAQAVAVEALSNSGANAYKLADLPTLLRSAGSDVTAVAIANGGATAAGANTDAVTVSELNALVAKFGGTAFSTDRKVVDTAAEIVKLTSAALTKPSSIEVSGTSTATVAELLALNKFLTDNVVSIANTVKVKDTAASLEAAVKVPATLAALNVSHSVAVDGPATVKQIADINTALSGLTGGLTAVAAGYELKDAADKLAAGGASSIVNAAAKVTVDGTATVDQIDIIADAFAGSGQLGAALGTTIQYQLKDTAARILNGTGLNLADNNGGNLTGYQTGATKISITDAVVAPADAVSLRALANFDGVYAIEGNVSQLDAANANGNVAGKAALAGATKVTLVDNLTALFNAGVPVAAQDLASTVIASDALATLKIGNAIDKSKVDGFRLTDGPLAVTDANVADVNALSAIAPTEYKIVNTAYNTLMGNGAGIATFVANAAEVAVSGTLTVAEFTQLDARAGGKLTYTLTDSAAALAASGAAAATAGTQTITVDTTGTKENATVAEAKVLIARGITGFTIVDTAENISAAGDAVLLAENSGGTPFAAAIVINDGGEATLSVASALRVFDNGAGSPDGSAAAKYNLVDTAANLAAADPDLIGFAQNVTATTAATTATVGAGTEMSKLAGFSAMGQIVFDISGATYADVAAAADKARNVTVTGAISVAAAENLQAKTNSGTTSYKISDSAAFLALENTAANAAKIAAIEAATGTVVVNNGANANVSAAQATLIAAYAKPVVYDISSSYTDLTAATVSAAATSEARNIAITDGTLTAAKAAQVLALSNSGKVTFGTVTGTAADILALALNKSDAATALTASGDTSAADAASLIAKAAGIGASGATLAIDTIKDTAAALAAAKSATVTAGTAVVATTAATVAEAAKIYAAKATAVFDISDSYANIMRNSDAITDATNSAADVDAVLALSQAVKVTITDAVTVAQLLKVANEAGGSDQALYEIADVYRIVDADANIAAAMGANPALLAKAASVTLANGTAVKFDDIGFTLHIVGSRAEIDALPASLATANKLIEVSVAELTANPAFFSSLPGNVNYRVVDTYANLTSGNALISVADGITVTDNITMAQAAIVRNLGVAPGEVNFSVADTAVNLLSGTYTAELNAAINVTATTPVTVAEATTIRTAVGATGKATYSISQADTVTIVSGDADALSGATNITITATTAGSITEAEAAIILAAKNSGNTVIAHVDANVANIANLKALVALKDANETISKVTVSGGAALVADIQAIQALSSTLVYSLSDKAANLVAAAGATLNGATSITLSSGAATLEQLAVIDAATPSNANTTIAVEDTAANILAASTTLLARANGTITIKDTSLTASQATQLRALDEANGTFAINDEAKRIVDTSANLLLADNAVAVDAAASVEVSDTVSTQRAKQILTAVNLTGSQTIKVNISDVYASLALDPTTAGAANNVTITNLVSAMQARTATLWGVDGTLTFSVRDTATQLANPAYAAALAEAGAITVSTAATVDEAGKLSEMTNVTGYTIKDDATAVFDALNTVNAPGIADRATVLGATSITLEDAALVSEVVGTAAGATGEKLGLGSIPGLAFKVSDTGAEIAAALKVPAKAAVLLNATTVELSNTAGVSIADLTLMQDVLGESFLFDDDGNAQTANPYYIEDTFTNILAADQPFVEAATTLTVNGTDAADTIDMSGFLKGMVINGGAGADIITGGAGVDSIVLGNADAAIDNVIMTTITLSTSRDIVTNFTVGGNSDDTVTLGLANTTATTVAGAADVVASTTGAGIGGGLYALTGASSTADDVILLTATAAGPNSGNLAASGVLDGSELLKALTDSSAADAYTAIDATTTGDSVYLAAVQGSVTYLYFASDSNNDSVFGASEIALIGTFDAVLDAGSFLIA